MPTPTSLVQSHDLTEPLAIAGSSLSIGLRLFYRNYILALGPSQPSCIAIIIYAGLWLVILQVAVNPVLEVKWGTLSLRMVVMKGFELMRCPFKSFSVIELRIVVYANPFDLVLELMPPSLALEKLLYLLFRLLVIDNREGWV